MGQRLAPVSGSARTARQPKQRPPAPTPPKPEAGHQQSPRRRQQHDRLAASSPSALIDEQQVGRPASAVGGRPSSPMVAGCQSAASTPSRQPRQGRAKTTRVRINSNSEQIQDPNWLIRMGEERELARRDKQNHLKMFQRKLKSTLLGGSTDSAPPVSRCVAEPPAGPSPLATPTRTPVKVPVSILKQPSQGGQVRKGASPVRSNPTRKPAAAQQPASVQSQPQAAEAHPKVSGWRRKNLLAKTLVHLDEIRGNQRPIFMPSAPTKASRQTAESRFAQVVREAIQKNKSQDQECDRAAPEVALKSQEQARRGPTAETSPAREHRSSWSGQQQVSSTGSTPKRSPSGSQQTHLPAQLFSQLLLSATEPALPASVSSSQRDFKLQHKNNQLLQSLRRQSNELAAAEAARLAAADEASSAGSKAISGQRNEWRKLTGKLALLTTRPASSACSPRATSHLSASEAGKALRLTVSNQEESSPAGALLAPTGEKRKLSSSSMVVQPSSKAAADGAQQAQDVQQPRRSSLGALQRLGESDTDRKSHEHLEQSEQSGESRAAVESSRQPVIVRGDDLLHLLQVTTAEQPNMRRPSAESRLSQQSAAEAASEPASSTGHERASNSDETNNGLGEELEERKGQRQKPADLGSIVKKTSRVAFFQQKLRKIRWNQARHGQGQPQMEPKDELDAAQQLIVDPTLIGDAIEIFLRNAMQVAEPGSVESKNQRAAEEPRAIRETVNQESISITQPGLVLGAETTRSN